MKRAKIILYFLILLVSIASITSPVSSEPVFEPVDMVARVPEGNDFATKVLGDPWDMNEFSDVGKALNNSGRASLVQNFQVSNGIFSAESTDRNYALFYVLVPGTVFGMNIGKVGENYPIPSHTYHCMYIRLRVDTTSDYGWAAAWLPSFSEVTSEGNGGQTWGMKLHEDGLPPGSWRVYSVDLAAPPGDPGYFFENWMDRPYWKGLRIYPTATANTRFDVDWIRLTDCQPVNYTVEWQSFYGQTRLWAGIGQQQKDIYITSLGSWQSSYTWDVQGLEPGQYYLGVEANGQMNWLPQSLYIEPAPIITFTSPSPFSGDDYATLAGNPWDFTDEQDAPRIECTNGTVSEGVLDLVTPPPSQTPNICKGSIIGEVDSKVFLNIPDSSLTGAQYRYLSFRHYISGDHEVAADGMIGRWIWRYGDCTQVSQDIPYQVGWHTYTIDLYDPALGFAEAAAGCGRNYWQNAGNIWRIRFDPNENWTGNLVPAMTFHQQFDWIRLTKMPRVEKGDTFRIRIQSNKNQSDLSMAFYYTTDPVSQPYQNRVVSYRSQPPVMEEYNLYIPMVLNFWNVFDLGGTSYPWDISAVTPNTYYICVRADDGYNQATYCSEVPVEVVP
jgi:hypothetical protein